MLLKTDTQKNLSSKFLHKINKIRNFINNTKDVCGTSANIDTEIFIDM